MGRPSAFTMQVRHREREARREWSQLTESERRTRIEHQCWKHDNQNRALKALEPHIAHLRDDSQGAPTLESVYAAGMDDGTVRLYVNGNKRYPAITNLELERLVDYLKDEGYIVLHQFHSMRRGRTRGVLHHTKYLTSLVLESPLPVHCKGCRKPIALHQPVTIYCGACSDRLNGVPQ